VLHILLEIKTIQKSEQKLKQHWKPAVKRFFARVVSLVCPLPSYRLARAGGAIVHAEWPVAH
jgi:hypothetical protein